MTQMATSDSTNLNEESITDSDRIKFSCCIHQSNATILEELDEASAFSANTPKNYDIDNNNKNA